ncbi:unnamed protein product [Brassicogethes aeneus]|uniref:U1-type domain-containing protein n=1 Tax=Brassicogethes aeneus TaxID=1431903 RepID=A0A9P0AS98_BRAAE|nr:unnamed protein product [Brassicogethes aeneus]
MTYTLQNLFNGGSDVSDVFSEFQGQERPSSSNVLSSEELSSAGEGENSAQKKPKTKGCKTTPENKEKGKRKRGRQLNKFCDSWLNDPEFSKWLAKSTNKKNGHEYAFCKVCNSEIIAHRNDIRRHSSSEKHSYNAKQIFTNRTVVDMNYLAPDDLTKRAELKLCSLLATNNLPFSLIFKKHFSGFKNCGQNCCQTNQGYVYDNRKFRQNF